MSENTSGNHSGDPEINDPNNNNNTTTPIQSHQSEDAQSNVSSDDFICSTATTTPTLATTVNHNDYLGDPLLPTPSHIRLYDHHMTGSQQMIHYPSMSTEEQEATTTTASEENHFSFVTSPSPPCSPSTLPSLPPSLSPSIASETATTTTIVTPTEESSSSSLFYYVQHYFAHDDQDQQQQLQHQFQQYESLPSFHSLASSSSSLIDDTDDYNQEQQQPQQSPFLLQQTIMNDPSLQESIQEQQPEQVFPINDTIDQENNSHNKNDSNSECIQNEMTDVVNDNNNNNISNSESAVSTEHVHDGSEQSSSANNQITLNNDDLVTRSLNENASASSSEKNSESIPNQSSIESDTVFVQSNSDNNDTLNDKNTLSNVLKFINETYQFIPMNNQPTVSTEVLPLSSVIVPNESPMYTITTFESVDHMLSSQMNNENQKKKRKKCKPKSTINATATKTTSSSQPAASSSSAPDSALVASSVGTVMTSTAIPAHVANATVATTVPVSASPNNKTPQRNLKRKLLLSDDSMKTKEKRTTETHVCVVCKSVVSYIKGATDKLLGEYKEVFPDFDMTCGKVCDKCYRRCLQHRKMKDPNAIKSRRKRLSSVAPVVETTGIPEKPPQDSDEPVQIDTPSEVLAQLPAPQSEPIEILTNFDSRVLNIMDNMTDRNAINEMGGVKEAALDTEVMIETPTMLNVIPSLDTTAITDNVENITIADITSTEYISNATNTHDINDNIPTIEPINIVENTNDTSATTILNVENVIDHVIDNTIENTDVGVINTIDVVEKPLEADASPTEEIPPVTIETHHQNNIFSEELGLMATETGFDDSTPMRPYQKRSARKSTIPMEIQLLLQQQEEQKLIDKQNAGREKNNQSKEKQTPSRPKRRARASTKKKTTVSLDDIDFDFDETPVKKRKTPKRQKPNPPKNERPRREKTKPTEKQQEKKTDVSIDLGLENIQTENEVVDSEGFIRVRDNHEFFRKCSLRYSSTIQAKLDSRTRSVLNKWLSTKAGTCDIQHANTIEAIKSGEMLKCALYMMKNNPLRVTVKATENIADGECIGIYTGALRTADGFAKRDTLALDNIWAFDIPEDALPDYPGKALVVEAVEGGNISRFVQDATWHNSQGNNIKAVPIYHRDYAPGVFVAFVAEYDIFAGEEILMDWGSSCREQIQLQQLDGQCSLSFYSHFYCLALQQAVNQYVPLEYRSGKEKPREVDVDELQYDMFKGKYVQNSQIDHGAILEHINKTNIKRKRGNYEDSEDEELHGPPRKVPKTLPALSVRDGMPKVDADFAFDYRRCKILRQVLVDLEPSTLRDLNETDHTPLLHDVLNDFFPPNSPIPSRILKGFVPKAKVVEVISIGHPVRWYAPPNDRAFALAASEPIRKGEPIGLYIGRLSEEVSDEKEFDSYAFSVVVDDIKLVMENFRAGNECRFINDKFRREEDDHSINATAHLTWLLVDKNWIPTILFKATKSIAVDDEIVTDYGDTFWKKICRNSSYEHQEFNAKAQSKIEYLEGLLKQHQAPLPKWPKTLPAKFKGGIDYDDHLEEDDIEIVLIDEDDEDEVMEVTTADYPQVVALDELFVNPSPQCDIGLPAESDDDESPILLMDSFELE